MIDPTRHLQLEELNMVELCTRILSNARNELYMNMLYLDVALSSLGYEAAPDCQGVGTDGFVIYYRPEALARLFQRGRVLVNRSYLHMVLHCLFCHPDTRGRREMRDWNLACDIAVESVIDGLYLRCIHHPLSLYRQDWYGRMKKQLSVLNAEGVFHILQETELSSEQKERLEAEFTVDSHQYWELPDEDPKRCITRQNQWSRNRERMQTEMETIGNQQNEDLKSLLEHVQVENRERYDYRQFLRKFSVWKEEMQVDPDSFDYGFYSYGISLYGNMPLVEPLESKEISRIEDFVIVIDTSMSCSGELVRRFLEETYGVLCETDSYFKKTNIHILQCDEQIRQDCRIASQEEMKAYMENFVIIGQGGTDFRPAFEYVNRMVRQGMFHRLRGLLYFTDGEGIYPVKKPVYDTVFIFVKDQYTDISVPPWAMKLILEPGQLTGSAPESAKEPYGKPAGAATKEKHGKSAAAAAKEKAGDKKL